MQNINFLYNLIILYKLIKCIYYILFFIIQYILLCFLCILNKKNNLNLF